MTIELYNESNVDSRAIHLTNSVGTVSTMVGVEFSHPSGVFRLNQFTNATHFKATFAGVEYVYRITGFTAINGGVCEYSYTLDYLKDYCSKNDFKSTLGEGIVHRSTLKANWSRWVSDSNVLPTGKQTYSSYDLGPLIPSDPLIPNYIMVLKDPYASGGDRPAKYKIFILQNNRLADSLANLFRASINGDKLLLDGQSARDVLGDRYTDKALLWIAEALNLIVGIYAIPRNANFTPLGGGTSGLITFFTKTDGPEGEEVSYPIQLEGVLGYEIEYKCTLTVSITTEGDSTLAIRDFRDFDYKKYRLYVPFFGMLDAPIKDYFSFPDDPDDPGESPYATLILQYTFNFADGSMGINWLHNNTEIPANSIQTVPLPRIIIPSNQYSESMGREHISRNVDEANNGLSILSSASGIIAGAAAGGVVGAAIGGAIAMTTNTAKIEQSHAATAKSIDAKQTVYNGISSGFAGFVYNHTILEVTTYKTEFFWRKYGYICNNRIKNAEFADGFKYWLDITDIPIYGPEWYANGVKSDMSLSYILYNE